ncbi:efflux RND transporter periplasmic adaptor subunit [Thiomonas sp. FB-6]|uniref:efflux RND transporter periplasmic adaptor subunit n=1 Tax=Thiomonas sp. FB-6 TaxID=1158291 RepID=UPI0003701444|nr:efflux RND transporter periplasmic adaptor subunit [Thiomonas sp. FB-6]
MTHPSLPAALKPLAIAPVLALAVVLAAGCSRHEPAPREAAPRVVDARTLTLAARDAATRTLLSGVVASSQQVQVASRLMGYIRSVDVHEGQRVKAGQTLLQIDPTDIEGQVAQARAGLAQAQANLADAQTDYQRFGKLYRADAVTRQQWDGIQLRYKVAQQQVAAARAGFDTASSQMRYARVSSPIDGVVVQKMANAGDLATPGRPLLVVEGEGRLQVRVQAPAEVFERLRIGEQVPVLAGTREWPGTVAEAVPVADPLSHTHAVKIDLPAQAGLASGSFVRVAFALGSAPQLRLPVSALVERAGMQGVFVVDAQGIAHFRLVRTGEAAGGLVDVQAGLQPGETVVTSDLDQMLNGVKVGGGHRG